MSSSCKMHERLWIDTGPLISLHRQLPRSGVEPTPMAATAAAQIRGQREGERSARATRATTRGPWPLRWAWKNPPISSQQHFYVECVPSLCFSQTLKSACKTGAHHSGDLKNSHLCCAGRLFFCLATEAIITHSFFPPNKNSKRVADAATRYIKHTVEEDLFTSFTLEKVEIPQCRSTLLQIKV